MVGSVAEAVEIYRQELRRYVVWSNQMATNYPYIKTTGIMSLSSGNYQEFLKRDARLRGMVDVLGLTPQEEAAIDDECGVRR